MANDKAISVEHFEGLARFARILGDHGFAVYRYRYDFLAFGSWDLEVGTRHRHFRVVREGKNGMLRLAEATVRGAELAGEWEERDRKALAFEMTEAQTWDLVADIVRTHLSAL